MSETKKSSAHQRSVEGYLKPNLHSFFTDYINKNEISKSAAINDAVKALKEKQTSKK